VKKEGVPFVPNVLDGILTDRDLMYDSIHPNDAGYTKVAERVVPKLKEILGK
jgi:lysophospholipase L1-like esterase